MEEFHLMGEFKRISNLVKRKVDCSEVIKNLSELTGTQGHIINFVGKKNACGQEVYQKDIENEMSLRRSSVTGLLSAMEEKGFIQRQSVKSDKRINKIVLTDKAKAFNKSVIEYFDDLDKEVKSIFNEKEYEDLKEYLKRIEIYLKKENV